RSNPRQTGRIQSFSCPLRMEYSEYWRSQTLECHSRPYGIRVSARTEFPRNAVLGQFAEGEANRLELPSGSEGHRPDPRPTRVSCSESKILYSSSRYDSLREVASLRRL